MCYLCLYGSNFNEFKNHISFWNGKSYTCIACQNFLVICEGRYTKTFIVLLFILFALHYYFTCVLYFAVFLSSRYVFSCVICFRFIHFILISTAHALFLTCLPVSLRAYVMILFVSSLSSKSSDRKCLVNIRDILKRYF